MRNLIPDGYGHDQRPCVRELFAFLGVEIPRQATAFYLKMTLDDVRVTWWQTRMGISLTETRKSSKIGPELYASEEFKRFCAHYGIPRELHTIDLEFRFAEGEMPYVVQKYAVTEECPDEIDQPKEVRMESAANLDREYIRTTVMNETVLDYDPSTYIGQITLDEMLGMIPRGSGLTQAEEQEITQRVNERVREILADKPLNVAASVWNNKPTLVDGTQPWIPVVNERVQTREYAEAFGALRIVSIDGGLAMCKGEETSLYRRFRLSDLEPVK